MDTDTLHRALKALGYLVALVLSICVHEFGHAFVADRLGDRLPRAQGRVTLNPLMHIDPIGTLAMPLVAMLAGPVIGSRILGWGRPVQTSLREADLKHKISLGTANALIAFAGPFMNLAFALVLSMPFVVLARQGELGLAHAVAGVIGMNIMLCLFNLIPCPPLDGGAILARLLPRRLQWVSTNLNRYGFIVLVALLVTGALGYVMIPAQIAFDHWLRFLLGLVK